MIAPEPALVAHAELVGITMPIQLLAGTAEVVTPIDWVVVAPVLALHPEVSIRVPLASAVPLAAYHTCNVAVPPTRVSGLQLTLTTVPALVLKRTGLDRPLRFIPAAHEKSIGLPWPT